jgi:hypothetical protein
VPDERGEAIGWLVWVDSVARVEKKHLLPDSTLSALLDDAVKDRNHPTGAKDRADQSPIRKITIPREPRLIPCSLFRREI